MEAINMVLDDIYIIFQAPKVRGYEELRPAEGIRENCISLLQSGPNTCREVQNQDRLVDLNPLGASIRKILEEIDIQRNKLLQEGKGIELCRPLCRLPEVQEGDWTNQDGTS